MKVSSVEIEQKEPLHRYQPDHPDAITEGSPERTTDEWLEILRAHDVPCQPIDQHRTDETLQDQQRIVVQCGVQLP